MNSSRNVGCVSVVQLPVSLYILFHAGTCVWPEKTFYILHGLNIKQHTTCSVGLPGQVIIPERMCAFARKQSRSLPHFHWPFCAIHTERGLSESHAFRACNPPPLFTGKTPSPVCASGRWSWAGRDCKEHKQMVVAWQGDLEVCVSVCVCV